MIIACLGDSLTAGDYGVFGKSGIANVKSENYPYFLGRILGAEVKNYGKCGFKAGACLRYYEAGNADVKDADIIIIMLGTNGGHSESSETQENANYKRLTELCKRDAPMAKIVLCTPPHATSDPKYSNCGYAPQVKQAVGFVRKYAKEEGFDLIDTAICPSFTEETEHIMQPNDGLHFGKDGYQALAEFIASELRKICPALANDSKSI